MRIGPIAWLMAQGVADLELAAAGVRELSEAFAPGVASGDRFADMSLLDR